VITPTKGDSTMTRGASPPHRRTEINPDRLHSDAAGIGAGLWVLLINTHYWKDAVLARLSGERDERSERPDEYAESTREPSTDPAVVKATSVLPAVLPSAPVGQAPSASDVDRWIFPRDMPGEYARQLTSEHLVRRMMQGRPKYVWEMKPGMTDNHFLDCRIMNMAGADLHGVGIMATPEPSSRLQAGVLATSQAEQQKKNVAAAQLQQTASLRGQLARSTLRQ